MAVTEGDNRHGAAYFGLVALSARLRDTLTTF